MIHFCDDITNVDLSRIMFSLILGTWYLIPDTCNRKSSLIMTSNEICIHGQMLGCQVFAAGGEYSASSVSGHPPTDAG